MRPIGRCFVLGAGFSKSCGLPLARELSYWAWLERSKASLVGPTADSKPVAAGDFGSEVVSAELNVIRALFPSCRCDREDSGSWPDFEELLTMVNEAADLAADVERATGVPSRRDELSAARNLLESMMHYLHEATRTALAGRMDPVHRFLRSLEETDVVISFNWDLLLECAATDSNPVGYSLDATPGVRLLKPHGSLNLAELPRARLEELEAKAINVHSLKVEAAYERDGQPWVVVRPENPRAAYERLAFARKDERVVVAPDLRKRYLSPWLHAQWAMAVQAIAAAREIIVIGFSLPRADLRPRVLFCVPRLSGGPSPAIQIVDPEPKPVVERFSEFTGITPSVFKGTLTEWLADRESSGDPAGQTGVET